MVEVSRDIVSAPHFAAEVQNLAPLGGTGAFFTALGDVRTARVDTSAAEAIGLAADLGDCGGGRHNGVRVCPETLYVPHLRLGQF